MLPGRVIFEEEYEPGNDSEKKRGWFYHIALFEKDGVTPVYKNNGGICNYKGITQDFRHRLLQHNQIIAGGAASTKRMMYTGGVSKDVALSRVWKFLYLIGDFNDTYCRQFEVASKTDFKSYRAKQLPLETRNYLKSLRQTSDGKPILSSIVATLETLNMNPWVEKGPDTTTVPLTIYWGEVGYKPILPVADYLPPYIQERIITREEKRQMLEITSSRARQWRMPPW